MGFFSSLWKIRSSVTQLLWAGKEFSWWRHCSITVVLLAFTNVLVIFVPTIRDIFGFIGKHLHITSGSPLKLGKCSYGLIELYLPVHNFFFLCFVNRCICSSYADLYSSICLLYQTSQEGTNEVSAKDWGMYRQTYKDYTCLLMQSKKISFLLHKLIIN